MMPGEPGIITSFENMETFRKDDNYYVLQKQRWKLGII